jgi:hypothetical protein
MQSQGLNTSREAASPMDEPDRLPATLAMEDAASALPVESYWIVGGKYAAPEFSRLIWSPAVGPFKDRQDAETSCRQLRAAYGEDAAMRFAVVRELSLESAA